MGATESDNGPITKYLEKASSKAVSNSSMPNPNGSEFFWGCTLSKDKPEHSFSFEEEEDDKDYLVHTLFIRHSVLGQGVAEKVRHILEVETKNFAGEILKLPIASLMVGGKEMCLLDINFSSNSPVTFRLIHGDGPLHLSAQQLVEFPQPENLDTTELECTEDETTAEESPIQVKRKAIITKSSQSKRSKVEPEEEEEEEEEESMEEEEESEESPVKTKKSKKNKKSPEKAKSKTKVKAKEVATKKKGKRSK